MELVVVVVPDIFAEAIMVGSRCSRQASRVELLMGAPAALENVCRTNDKRRLRRQAAGTNRLAVRRHG